MVTATHSKVKGLSQRTSKVCADTSKHQTGKAVKFTVVHCPKCDVGLCLDDCVEGTMPAKDDSNLVWIFEH
jgi:hypothetical protein